MKLTSGPERRHTSPNSNSWTPVCSLNLPPSVRLPYRDYLPRRPYFGAEYGLHFAAPQGLSTASEASARDVAALIEQVRSGGIGGVFIENLADSRIIQQIASETGLSVGGTLFTGALSDLDGPAPTYAAMIAHNAEQLLQSLRAAEENGAC